MRRRSLFTLCIVAGICAAILCATAASAAPSKMSSGFYYPTERSWTGTSGGSSGDPKQPWNDGSPGGRIYGYLDSAAPSALGKQHVGMDIRAAYNSAVYAICDGTIYRYINSGDSRYWCIIVRHGLSDGTSFYAVYGHCRIKSGYSTGKVIKAGENFGYINESGNQHIHFGIKMDSNFNTGWGHLATGTNANSIGWRGPRTWLLSHTPSGGGGTTPPPDDGGGTNPPPDDGGGTNPPPSGDPVNGLIVTSASNIFADGFYAQTANGSEGLHLQYGTSGGPALVPGDIINVSNYGLVTVNGEQVLRNAVVTDQGDTAVPNPVQVNCSQLKSEGIDVGLLVTLSGKVGYRKSDGTAFYVEDGSGVADAYHPGIRVRCDGFANGSKIAMPAAGTTVTITGIYSRANVQGTIVSCIRLREASDIR